MQLSLNYLESVDSKAPPLGRPWVFSVVFFMLILEGFGYLGV